MTPSCPIQRLRLTVTGAVQGVGFRPFVYRLAADLALAGWVMNTGRGVQMELEGPVTHLGQFFDRLHNELPPLAHIRDCRREMVAAVGYTRFEVRESDRGTEKVAMVMPDIATCQDCRREITDPQNRRYRYPFTNCTNCGPRYSIIESLPYDRVNTTMRIFPMCEACRAEYEDPTNRRFHAQPNACPECGPHLELWDSDKKVLAVRDEALQSAADAIRDGRIVALKGLGGFQLLVDARNHAAVTRLRQRKGREEKPLAVMFDEFESVARECLISAEEKKLLVSPEAPITLLRRLDDSVSNVAPSVAPGNPYLGVMLPYTPLHLLLLADLGFPVVATSGNLSEEPICIDEHEAAARLGGIADIFLVHNRPILRQVDDSVAQVIAGSARVLRAARGFAPVRVSMPASVQHCLAVGPHLKNSVAVAVGDSAFVSQHIGDLETRPAYEAMERTAGSLLRLYDLAPKKVATDLHPDYASTRFADSLGLPAIRVQHHYAHVLSCMAENELSGPVLGVAWDGTGLGSDGTIWGGEFLLVENGSFSRVAHLRTFRLPGGEQAVLNPPRSALGLLYEVFGNGAADDFAEFLPNTLSRNDLANLVVMLKNGINTPATSSAGRLFDAVASLLGICQFNRYNGQAAMMLAFAAEETNTEDRYPIRIEEKNGILVLDWEPMIRDILFEKQKMRTTGVLAAKFHNSLVEGICTIAERIDCPTVVLTGGCFQNRILAERAAARLMEYGFRPYLHRRVPPNDGGIALGQLIAAGLNHNGS